MATRYPQGGRYLRYGCAREAVDHGGPACQSLSGRGLDALVGGLIVEALAPAAVEASLRLAEDVELERAALQRQWRQRLERARYEAERARRQYDAVDPENRLVARSLERQWERALADELRLRAEHERFVATRPVPLTTAELAAIRRLTEDIPALWHAPTTTARDRQAIARLLLERVVVTVEGESERVGGTCHGGGGGGGGRGGGGPLPLGRGRADRARADPSGQAAGPAEHLPGAAGADRRLARGGLAGTGSRRDPQPGGVAPAEAARDVHGRHGPRPAPPPGCRARGRRRAVPHGRAAVPRGGDAAGAGRTSGDAGADGLWLAAAWRAAGAARLGRTAADLAGHGRRGRDRAPAGAPRRRPAGPRPRFTCIHTERLLRRIMPGRCPLGPLHSRPLRRASAACRRGW